ncbi:hypothetical protein AX15_003022 [Amanita polypyramis BW_CC]|nr:hypothetical protein AX15_003022 [Amanita polypyramis BW_CC]
MPSLETAQAVIAQYKPSYMPVAIFVGGTSGIGQSMAQRFANQTGGNAHIIIIGRNEAAAKSIIASFPKPSSGADIHPGWKHEFVYCDVQLMKNVQATTKALSERLAKVNFLVLSAGYFDFRGREDTAEGIDKKMATRYYSRWALVDGLLPLLRKARDASEAVSVMSVLAAGMGGKIDLDDLDLKKSYGGLKASVATGTYNDMMMVVSSFFYSSVNILLSESIGVRSQGA